MPDAMGPVCPVGRRCSVASAERRKHLLISLWGICSPARPTVSEDRDQPKVIRETPAKMDIAEENIVSAVSKEGIARARELTGALRTTPGRVPHQMVRQAFLE